MKNKKTKIETPQYKIVASENFPFFNAYHDDAYILSHDCRSMVAVSEEGMKYILDNQSRKEIVVYRIDKGIISGAVEKCDFGIYTENDILFLIELKSPEREYGKALQQIINTIEILIKSHNSPVSNLNARIVIHKYPNTLTAKERKLENYIISNYHCDLQHGTKTMTEVLP
ncbi:MAG: hypothetical protein J6T70_08585 [Bacteroidales bacterium]|nr:hypothetical protein [Bacteroidales bacterium]